MVMIKEGVSKDLIIVTLSVILIILVGFIFLVKEADNELPFGKSEYPSSKLKDYTVDGCVELARKITLMRDKCKELGISKLYGYEDSKYDCYNGNYDNFTCFGDYGMEKLFCYNQWETGECTGQRLFDEVALSEKCLEKFPSTIDVFTNCLTQIEDFDSYQN